MNLTDQQIEQIEASGKPDPQLASALLEQAMNGDSVVDTKTGGEPDTTQVEDTGNANTGSQPAPTPAPSEEELNATNAVIQAKDGKHTIPFEKLEEARSNAQHWKQQAALAEQALAELRQSAPANTQAEQNLEAAQAAIAASGNNIDVIAMFGDFSEEAIAKGVESLIEQRVPGLIQSAVEQALAPYQAQQAQSAEQVHFEEIHAAHSDIESIVDSQQFNNWITGQPDFIQSAYNGVLENGTSKQVIDLLNLYKTSNNLIQPSVPVTDLKETAKQAVNKAQTQVPHSVSDLPAGSPAGVTRDERLAALSPAQLAEEMQGWTPEQIEKFVDRRA